MRKRVLSVLAVAAAVLLFPAAPASAAELTAAGWWSRTASPLPVDPTAPRVEEGQLRVQGAPSGPTAIAALRYSFAAGETDPVLTIVPTDPSTVPESARLLACRTTTPWEEASGGSFDEAPEYDCTNAVEATRGADASFVLSLAPLASDAGLDIALVPAERSVFSLTFDRPGPGALTTRSSGSSSGGGFSDPFSPSPAPSSEPSPSSDSGPSFGDSTGGGSDSFSDSFPSAAAPSFDAPATEAPAPTEAPSSDEVAAPATEGNPFGSVLRSDEDGSSSGGTDRARDLGLIVLAAGLAVVGYAWVASGGLPRFGRTA